MLIKQHMNYQRERHRTSIQMLYIKKKGGEKNQNKKEKKKRERNETQLASQLLKTISRKHALLIGQRRQDLE